MEEALHDTSLFGLARRLNDHGSTIPLPEFNATAVDVESAAIHRQGRCLTA